MNFGKFRKAWKASLGIGIGFLVIGVYWFMNSGSGTPQEKIGTVFMMYNAVFIGIGFTIYVTLKSQ